METYKSKYSLRNKVKGGEKVEQPHGSKDCHPGGKFASLVGGPATCPR